MISIFVANLNGGGAERMMLNLAKGFADKNINTELVLSSAVGPFLNEVPDNVKIVDLKSPRVLFSVFKLRKYLNNAQPDVMISTLSRVNIAAIIAKKISQTKTKLILREANTFSVYFGSNKSKWDKIIDYAVKKLYPYSDNIVAVSKGVADDLCSELSIPKAKVKVIYNPVIDQKVFDMAEQKVEHPWLGDNGPPVIISAGRISEQKDFSTLIRAFNESLKIMDLRLLILGKYDVEDAEYLNLVELIEKFELKEKVDFAGFVSNPFAYFSRASVFVLSSKWEGLPGVLIQALACGCPVVSTNCPSGPDEILENGKYGNLVEVGDYMGLSKAIIAKVLEGGNNRNELIERSLTFSVSQAIQNYLALVESAIENR